METGIAKQLFKIFSKNIIQQKAYLSELDTPIGDGDHGSNMARGVTALQSVLEETAFESAADVFKSAAMTLMSNVGGASGPLYGSAFLRISQALQHNQSLTEALENGLDALKQRGKSSIGDKTMIDVWGPAIEALKNNALTEDKAQELADNTKEMKAKKGRASYLGERSVGHIDPGAMSSAYFFKALVQVGMNDTL